MLPTSHTSCTNTQEKNERFKDLEKSFYKAESQLKEFYKTHQEMCKNICEEAPLEHFKTLSLSNPSKIEKKIEKIKDGVFTQGQTLKNIYEKHDRICSMLGLDKEINTANQKKRVAIYPFDGP